jgi:hypothetical protein
MNDCKPVEVDVVNRSVFFTPTFQFKLGPLRVTLVSSQPPEDGFRMLTIEVGNLRRDRAA